MITHAIKGWLRKVFAWWPWKQSTSMEYQPLASSVIWQSTPETPFRSTREGVLPQNSALPRLSTVEERSEHSARQSRSEDSSVTPAAPTGATGTPEERPPHTPSTQQRLEFLRYLIQRGLVNEGFEQDPTDRPL